MLKDEDKERMMSMLISTPEEREATLMRYQDGEEVFDISKDPFNHMMRIIFRGWKPFILSAIALDGGTHFSRFFKQLPITQKVLSQNLKEMQEDELITRTVLPEVPPRVVYNLTQQGKGLVGLLDMVYDWGWNDMKRKGMPVDILGEMWHGYRNCDPELMDSPFSMGKKQ